MISGIGSFGGSMTFAVPLPDQLDERNLYLAYVCPACGHPTIEHEVEGGSLRVNMACYHEDMVSVPKIEHLMGYTHRYMDSVMIHKTERVQCPCRLHDMCEEFEIVCDRHREFQQEGWKRQMLRLCETEWIRLFHESLRAAQQVFDLADGMDRMKRTYSVPEHIVALIREHR